MKKLIRIAAQVILALLIIPFVLEKPVHSLLEGAGLTGEYSYEILLGITAAVIFLIIDRKRIGARRQQRRAADSAPRPSPRRSISSASFPKGGS